MMMIADNDNAIHTHGFSRRAWDYLQTYKKGHESSCRCSAIGGGGKKRKQNMH
jgi:hypothetical protein